ncbi:MAG TPA: hypothetical protein VMT61_11495 [Candidatus Binataceae bacterium]|nr:hypothetical protein [Candidatus Binataceae bacterium]
MQRVTVLQTESGAKVTVRLDNWGNGVDKAYRRWVRDQDGWHCLETRETAHEPQAGSGFLSGLLYQVGLRKAR